MIPGKVFERKYNADSIEKNNAGAILSSEEFTSDSVRRTAERVIGSEVMMENARKLGDKLVSAGGIETILQEIRKPATL